MNRLPQEIIDLIVFFLPERPDTFHVSYLGNPPSRAQYATISSKFQTATERSTFSHLRIKSDELETFAQYLKPSRRGFLQNLQYIVQLPEINTAVSKLFERSAETKAIRASPPHAHAHHSSRSRCAASAWVYIKAVIGCWDRASAPSIKVDLAARMPGLMDFRLRVESYELRYPGLVRKERRNLATMLKLRSEETKTISVAELNMSMDVDPINRMPPLPDLTYPKGYDPLGPSVRIWSQRLPEFRLYGVLDETFFWPHALEIEATPPEWRNLEYLGVFRERHTPSGWWYFMPTGNPGSGTPPRNPAEDPNDLPQPFTDNPTDGADPFDWEEEQYWTYRGTTHTPEEESLIRNVPNEYTMQPLFEGWAKAMQSMPSLRHARLFFEVDISHGKPGINIVDWEVVYESPDFNESSWWEDLGERERRSRRLIFHNTGGWRPHNDTMKLLQRIGEDSYPGTKSVLLAFNWWNEIEE
ncbi:hypothetical protein V493_06806 [Pseudogymnoascus sp. VKM F-4281 (FW-2241)]|nr:hypothetical protein V493_06806 [Pseudogymnoascus sp. VKM F-4281 (FW-2241)]